MGSSDAQVDEALAICRVHFPGCERSVFDPEQPLHHVTPSPFWLDQTEVTVSQFPTFAAATGHGTTAERAGASLRLGRGRGGVAAGRWGRLAASAGTGLAGGGGSPRRERELGRRDILRPGPRREPHRAPCGGVARHAWGFVGRPSGIPARRLPGRDLPMQPARSSASAARGTRSPRPAASAAFHSNAVGIYGTPKLEGLHACAWGASERLTRRRQQRSHSRSRPRRRRRDGLNTYPRRNSAR